jgi:histidinol-phosphate aminotransferase
VDLHVCECVCISIGVFVCECVCLCLCSLCSLWFHVLLNYAPFSKNTGSDDALILICQTFLRTGLNVLAPVPTYEHFCVNASGTGATLIRMAMADVLQPCEDEISDAVEKHRCRVVYLVSPNNPTGVQWCEESVRRLATRHTQTIFIVDEAYYEFGRRAADGSGEPLTCGRLATELENVVVTRTFSKAFCLAAVRCGYLIAHPNTVELFRVRYNPKSVNTFAQAAASAALMEFDSYYRPYIYVINEQRERFAAQLREHGFLAKVGWLV